MAGQQLQSKKASDTVSSEECTQYSQAWESEDNSSQDVAESSKMVEQGESAVKVVGEQTGDIIQDLGTITAKFTVSKV
jgi:hypothetical protein